MCVYAGKSALAFHLAPANSSGCRSSQGQTELLSTFCYKFSTHFFFFFWVSWALLFCIVSGASERIILFGLLEWMGQYALWGICAFQWIWLAALGRIGMSHSNSLQMVCLEWCRTNWLVDYEDPYMHHPLPLHPSRSQQALHIFNAPAAC